MVGKYELQKEETYKNSNERNVQTSNKYKLVHSRTINRNQDKNKHPVPGNKQQNGRNFEYNKYVNRGKEKQEMENKRKDKQVNGKNPEHYKT